MIPKYLVLGAGILTVLSGVLLVLFSGEIDGGFSTGSLLVIGGGILMVFGMRGGTAPDGQPRPGTATQAQKQTLPIALPRLLPPGWAFILFGLLCIVIGLVQGFDGHVGGKGMPIRHDPVGAWVVGGTMIVLGGVATGYGGWRIWRSRR